MFEMLTSIGLKGHDLALLILCPAGAALGSYAHAILQMINPHQMPGVGGTVPLSFVDGMGRFAWTIFRISLGGILGLVVALYFIGSIQENISTVSKIVALSILLGYSAPKLWLSQERIILKQSEKFLDTQLDQHSSLPAPQRGRGE